MSEDLRQGPGQPRRTRTVFLLIIAAAALMRFHAAVSLPVISDESNIGISLADKISFSPAHPNLPIRGLHHPALPAYLIKLSALTFGYTQLGYRALHVFGGVFAIILAFHATSRLFGQRAALWTAALLAFNEYHIVVSSLATAKGPHLFFVMASIYAFVRFLQAERPAFLYFASAFAGLAFYCKEHSVLILAAGFLTLLMPRYRKWLRAPHAYVACALFVCLIAPDVAANFGPQRPPQESVVGAGPAIYRDHLQRIGGIGLSPYPLLFFGRDTTMWLADRYGGVLADSSPEYPAMNAAAGVFLLAVAISTTFTALAPAARFLPILFWVVFGTFTLIRPGQPTNGMDPVTWYWVDMALFPAVMLAGMVLARSQGSTGVLARAIAVVSMLLGVIRMVFLPA